MTFIWPKDPLPEHPGGVNPKTGEVGGPRWDFGFFYLKSFYWKVSTFFVITGGRSQPDMAIGRERDEWQTSDLMWYLGCLCSRILDNSTGGDFLPCVGVSEKSWQCATEWDPSKMANKRGTKWDPSKRDPTKMANKRGGADNIKTRWKLSRHHRCSRNIFWPMNIHQCIKQEWSKHLMSI